MELGRTCRGGIGWAGSKGIHAVGSACVGGMRLMDGGDAQSRGLHVGGGVKWEFGYGLGVWWGNGARGVFLSAPV